MVVEEQARNCGIADLQLEPAKTKSAGNFPRVSMINR
jgi:hypothetical protein